MTENNINEETISDTHEEQVEGKRLRGWGIIVLLLLIFAGVTFMGTLNHVAMGLISNWDVYDVGNELFDYVEKNDQQFPPAEKWCDAMLEKENDYYSFKRYESNKDNFWYMLNKHIYEYDEIPDDMVVLFSGAPGWNKVGDADSVEANDYIKVFFGNRDTRAYRKSQIPHLRWRLEDSGAIPGPYVKTPLLVISSLLAIVFLLIFITCRQSFKIFWKLALGVGVISAVVGAFFAVPAEGIYYKFNSVGTLVAPWISSIWCFLIGVSFIILIGRIYKKYYPNVSMVGYAIVIGAITGIIASSVVHGYLMMVYEVETFSYMLAGSSFGIIAGVLLGWITSGLIKLYKNHPAILSVTSEVS